MAGECFQTLDIVRLRRTMARIHEQVSGQCGRIVVTRDGCDDVCILISKAELESLERALEIFAQSDEFKAMSDQIARVASECADCAPVQNVTE
jgi:PHD/YefM family antitoxin component YafN of YafNO toxin-antitoxin module